MSIFHCQAKAISRASGRSATAAAAYRAGERIIDERTGEIHDYRRKKGIVHSQIYVPQGVRMMSRSALWNLAEKAEKRKDAKVAREWELALPTELSPLNRMYLAQHFARVIVERYGVAVDMCIHAPGKKGDDRNHHVHVLTTTRVLRRDGFGEKTRVLDSPRTSGEEVTAVRKIWEQLCNHALELDMIPCPRPRCSGVSAARIAEGHQTSIVPASTYSASRLKTVGPVVAGGKTDSGNGRRATAG
ncbi:MAG: MobA/MobL family protein [Planctomycetaceae bacterium]|nr:MobA/MobL family protein [Planctomycetaceae bacterium]